MKAIICCLILCVVALGCDVAKSRAPAVDTAYPVAPAESSPPHRPRQHRTVQEMDRAVDRLLKRLDEYQGTLTSPQTEP